MPLRIFLLIGEFRHDGQPYKPARRGYVTREAEHSGTMAGGFEPHTGQILLLTLVAGSCRYNFGDLLT